MKSRYIFHDSKTTKAYLFLRREDKRVWLDKMESMNIQGCMYPSNSTAVVYM